MSVRYQNLESPHNYFREMWAGATTYPARAEQAVKDIIGAVGSTFVWMPSQLVRDQFTMDDKRRAATASVLIKSMSDEFFKCFKDCNATIS